MLSNNNRLPETLYQSIAGFLDAHYVAEPIDCIFEIRRLGASIRQKQERCESAVAPEFGKCLSIEDMLKQADAGFTENLLQRIDMTGKKDSEIYKRANISKQHFSKIRNNPNYKPTKPTAIALALALELSLEDTKDLIGRAGYALTNSSKFDLIIRYFIEQGNYDIMQINIALYEFDQPLLGA